MSSKKRLALLLLVFVGGALWFGLPFYRAMSYRMVCEKVVLRVAGQPTPKAVFALAKELKKLSRGSGIDPAKVEVTVRLRRVGFAEAPTYRLEASVVHGTWNDLLVGKVDDDHVTRDYLFELVRGGIELAGMPEETELAGR